MENKSTTFQQNYYYDLNSKSHSNYLQRRRLEISRRMTILHHKRSCLERELRAINNALQSLAKQAERDSTYEKLLL